MDLGSSLAKHVEAGVLYFNSLGDRPTAIICRCLTQYPVIKPRAPSDSDKLTRYWLKGVGG